MSKSIAKLTPEQEEFFKVLRLRVAWKQPYITHMILRLIPVNSPGLKTMAVDEYCRVYVDFDYFMAPERGMVFASQVLAHEPWHVLRKYWSRGRDISPNIRQKLWNLAHDAEINDDIVDFVPKDSVFPKTFNLPDYQTAEFYYAKLEEKFKLPDPKKRKPKPSKKQEEKDDITDKGKKDLREVREDKDEDEKDEKDPSDPQDENGDESEQDGDESEQDGDQDGDQDSDDGDEGDEDGDQPGNKSGKPGKNGKPSQGSGEPGDEDSEDGDSGDGDADGDSDDDSEELSDGSPGNGSCGTGTAELEEYLLKAGEAEVLSEMDQELLIQITADNIRNEASKNPGNVPGNLKMWADDQLKPTPTPWQKILRGAIRSALYWKKGQFDYNRKRPNRRQPVKGVQLPALQSPTPRLLMGVDTSGSHVPMLPRVLEEVHTIMKSSGVRGEQMRVFSVDTVVKGKMVAVNDPRKLVLSGGGGTDMMPAFALSKLDKKNHDIFILMTDGEIPSWPSAQPTSGVRYVVCILSFEGDSYADNSYARAQKEIGSWAKVVQIIVPKEQI